jgi:hypothetical protein
MTQFLVKKNNSESTLSVALNELDTTLVVADFLQFPLETPFHLTIWDSNTYNDPTEDANMEIVKVTEILSGVSYTIERAKENTTAKIHNVNSKVELLITVEHFTELENAINSIETNYATKSYVDSQISGENHWDILSGNTLTPYIRNSNIDLQDGNIYANNLNISNWDLAYGWGNHATVGYLTSITGLKLDQTSPQTTIGTFSFPKIDHGEVLIISKLGVETRYKASADTDIARGTILKTAVTAAVAGDVIFLPANTFDLGSSGIVLPTGTKLRGYGKDLTIIKSTGLISAIGAIVTGVGDVVFEDFTVQATGGLISQAPIGYGTVNTLPTSVTIRRVKAVGWSDAIYFYSNTTGTPTIIVEDSEAYASQDSFVIFGAVGNAPTINVYNTIIKSSGLNSGSYGAAAGVATRTNTTAIANFYNCYISAFDSYSSNYAIDANNSNTILNFYNCRLESAEVGTSFGDYDIRMAGSTVNFSHVQFDSTKIGSFSGILTYIDALSILNSLKTVDGTGSLLDADKLDGRHASDFYLATNPSNYIDLTDLSGSSPITYNSGTGAIGLSSSADFTSTGTWGFDSVELSAPETFHDIDFWYASSTGKTLVNATLANHTVNPASYAGTDVTESERNTLKIEDYTIWEVTEVGKYTSGVFKLIIPIPEANIAQLKVGLGMKHSTVGQTMQVYVWNFSTGAYEQIGADILSSTTVRREVTFTTTAGNYIGANGEVYVMGRTKGTGANSFIYFSKPMASYIPVKVIYDGGAIDSDVSIAGDLTLSGQLIGSNAVRLIGDDQGFYFSDGTGARYGMYFDTSMNTVVLKGPQVAVQSAGGYLDFGLNDYVTFSRITDPDGFTGVTMSSADPWMFDVLGMSIMMYSGSFTVGGATTLEVTSDNKIGFFGGTAVAQQTLNAYTSDAEGSAYTGIDNAQAGTVYAKLADLNTLRAAYETLRASYDDLRTKLKNTTLVA